MTDQRGEMPMTEVQRRILLVDDDESVARAYTTVLSHKGWAVQSAPNGKQASEILHRETFSAIVSDVSMPEMGGLEFLRTVRQQDLDVPVILMTGKPELESAMEAVQYGAFAYLVKPVGAQILDDTVRRAARCHDLAKLKRQALEVASEGRVLIGDRAGLEAKFDAAITMFWMAYQPIVSLRDHNVFGYEALLRSREPSLRGPGEVLDAAERLGRVHELGRAIRARVADEAREVPSGSKVFINLHALDLNDEELYAADLGLATMASRTVLEITERASLEGIKSVVPRVTKLRGMGFDIAVDDLGAGYAGLTSYALLEPEIAKIDMSLVRGIDKDARRQSIVRSMKSLCDELKTQVVAEGVETAAERDTLASLGCDLLQGYLFAKPDKGFPTPTW